MADIGQLPLPRPRPFPDEPCYVCRSCTIVVGYAEHLVSYALAIIPDCFLLTSVQVGNVFAELRVFERGVYRLSTLYCGNCFSLIGWKIDRAAGPLSTFFAEGRFILFTRCIYFWNTLNLQDPVWSPSAIP